MAEDVFNRSNDDSALWKRLAEPAAWAAPFAILSAALLVRPVGEFPILDDFDYSATVADFLRTGEIRLSDWPSMTLIGQVYWGAAFCLALENSFVSLRISTLGLHALGCFAAYGWLRGRGKSQPVSAYAAVAVATSPETLYFACSFMTDVPGLAWTLIVLLASSRALGGGSLAASACAGTTAALAYMFRQTAVIPLLAAILIESFRRRGRSAVFLAVPVVSVAIAHRYWLHRHGVPHHGSITMIDPATLLQTNVVAERLGRLAATLGLYLTPVALLLFAERRSWDRASRLRGGFVAAAAASAAIFWPSFIPYDGQTVFDLGLGADVSLDRPHVLLGPSVMIGGVRLSIFRVVTSAMAACSLGILAAAAPRWIRRADPVHWLLRLSLLGTAAFALISGAFYERYLIPVWSLAILGIAASTSLARPSPLAWAALLLFASAGVLGSDDYFRRFGAAWKALDDLRAEGIPVVDIDGGMEFAGWHLFNSLYRGKAERVRPFAHAMPEAARVEMIAPLVLNRYSPHRLAKRFAVAYVDDGDLIRRRHPYRSWLRQGVVYVLQRVGPARPTVPNPPSSMRRP